MAEQVVEERTVGKRVIEILGLISYLNEGEISLDMKLAELFPTFKALEAGMVEVELFGEFGFSITAEEITASMTIAQLIERMEALYRARRPWRR